MQSAGPRWTRRSALAAGAAVAAGWRGALAAGYPARTITLVVPTGAGGTLDATARLLADEMRAQLGASVVVDNRSGGGGAIATQFVARAPADGHVLLFTMTSHLSNAAIRSRSGYDPVRDFAAVSLFATSGAVVVVHPASPVRTWDDFVRAARTARGQSVGHWGVGTSTHFYAAMVEDVARLKLTTVPYRGEAALLAELMAGNLDAGFVSINAYRTLAQAGKLRGLAVTLRQRSAAVPDLPTLEELGVPGPGRLTGWFGLLAPAGTPAAAVERLSAVVAGYVRRPQVRAQLVEQLALAPEGSTPEAFGQLLQTEFADWKKAADAYGIQAE